MSSALSASSPALPWVASRTASPSSFIASVATRCCRSARSVTCLYRDGGRMPSRSATSPMVRLSKPASSARLAAAATTSPVARPAVGMNLRRQERDHQGGHRVRVPRVRVVTRGLDHRHGPPAGRQGGDDRIALGPRVREVRVLGAHDDQRGAADVRQLRGRVGGGRLAGLQELGHPARLEQLGAERRHVFAVVGGLGRIGQVQVPHPRRQAAQELRAHQQREPLAVAADPDEAAQAELLRPGERVDLDDAADQLRLLRGGDGGSPTGEGVPDDEGRPAQVTDHRQQVAGHIGARDGVPAQAGLTVPAQVRRHHPVAGRRQPRGEEAVDLTPVPDAV